MKLTICNKSPQQLITIKQHYEPSTIAYRVLMRHISNFNNHTEHLKEPRNHISNIKRGKAND